MSRELTEHSAMIQLFPREDGTTSIWDHPNFKSNVALPDDYRPITRPEQGLEMIQRNRLSEEQLTVLKIVADAVCANEDQLKRYLSSRHSASVTSRHLRFLARYGLVERHKCRLAFIEEDGKEVIRPPGPHTLGIGGYKLMKHLYRDGKYLEPDFWSRDSLAVQRYVAVNEIRCLTFESGNLKGWEWRPYIGGLSKYNKPFAAMLVDTGKNERLQVIVERVQMAQNFEGYFRTKLNEMRELYDRDGYIQIDGFEKSKLQQIVMLSVSSVALAKFLQETLRLHTYPFDVWFVIDEWISPTTGLEAAFAHVTKDGLRRKRISIFKKKPIE